MGQFVGVIGVLFFLAIEATLVGIFRRSKFGMTSTFFISLSVFSAIVIGGSYLSPNISVDEFSWLDWLAFTGVPIVCSVGVVQYAKKT